MLLFSFKHQPVTTDKSSTKKKKIKCLGLLPYLARGLNFAEAAEPGRGFAVDWLELGLRFGRVLDTEQL